MEKRKGITEGMTKQIRETSHEVLTERSKASAWPKDVDDAERRERARGTDGKDDAYGAGRARDRLGM